jgi:hypothetical protein
VTPGEFDHPAAHAGVARSGKSSLASFLATLVGSSRRAPAEKGALKELSVEPIRLRPACSRGTGTLEGWRITWASIARARNQRVSRKPSRPASWAQQSG